MTYEEDDHWCWDNYPRWLFSHSWTQSEDIGIRSFCLFSVWWCKRGPVGITLFGLSLEFNPYHKKEAE